MKRSRIALVGLLAAICFTAVHAQDGQTITGNVISYGTRAYSGLRTGNFTFRIKSFTPPNQIQRYLNVLQESGQDRLLSEVKNEDMGTFSVNNNLSRTVNVISRTNVGGKVLIRAVFERWTEFAELRGGYRSLDYPFGYIELTIDPQTGKGSGQYFAAAKIRWKDDKKNGYHVEIEDYATFPAKLANVKIER
jgi:hypothetical protein